MQSAQLSMAHINEQAFSFTKNLCNTPTKRPKGRTPVGWCDETESVWRALKRLVQAVFWHHIICYNIMGYVPESVFWTQNGQ